MSKVAPPCLGQTQPSFLLMLLLQARWSALPPAHYAKSEIGGDNKTLHPWTISLLWINPLLGHIPWREHGTRKHILIQSQVDCRMCLATSSRWFSSTSPTVAPGCRAPTSINDEIQINFSSNGFWNSSESKTCQKTFGADVTGLPAPKLQFLRTLLDENK